MRDDAVILEGLKEGMEKPGVADKFISLAIVELLMDIRRLLLKESKLGK